MYQTTQEFIAATKSLKEALLISLLLRKPLRIKTGKIGVIPLTSFSSYKLVVNDKMLLLPVDADSTPAAVERSLSRKIGGQDVRVICNYDSQEQQDSATADGQKAVYIEVEGNGAPATSAATADRIGITVSSSLAADAVLELLNFIVDSDDFSEAQQTKLHQGFYMMTRGGDFGVLMRLTEMVDATRPGSKHAERCHEAGFDPVLDLGVADSAKRETFLVCMASATVNRSGGMTLADLQRFFPMVAEPRIRRSNTADQGKPLPGATRTLSRMVETFFAKQ